ncbi:MAG TPA: hypothetical protein PLQ44_02680 [Candidatus Paceibacterota bacterium]|nr:hypothetical protein [Candidatus Paceibacterota bacterium]HPT40485.1 hypothetical protein [Candidatus Paceibacterota bacterium]
MIQNYLILFGLLSGYFSFISVHSAFAEFSIVWGVLALILLYYGVFQRPSLTPKEEIAMFLLRAIKTIFSLLAGAIVVLIAFILNIHSLFFIFIGTCFLSYQIFSFLIWKINKNRFVLTFKEKK